MAASGGYPRALVGLSALLMIVACAAPSAPPAPAGAPKPAGSQTAAPAGAAAAPVALSRVVFGNPGLGGATQFWAGFVAMDQGFFTAEGIQAEQLSLPSLPTLIQVLVAGDMQIISLPALAAAGAVAEGVPIKFVASTQEIPTVNVFVAPGIETWTDLKGKTLSPGNAPNTFYEVVFRMMLEANGVRDGEYMVRYMPSNARVPALQVGQIAGAATSGSEAMIARAQGLKELGAARDYVKDTQFAGLLVMDDWARANEDVLVRVLRAYLRGAAWLFNPANKAGAIRIIRETGDYDPQELDTYYDDLIAQKMLSRDLAPNLRGIESQLVMAQRMGALEKIPPLDTWVDLTYLDKASR